MASELKYYNRDAIYWRVADQYGFLLRNIMFNHYLKGNTTTSQLGRVLQQHHRSENPQQMEVAFSARLGDRHFLPDPETAYQAFTTWVKFWFLSVGKIKALVNDFFALLDLPPPAGRKSSAAFEDLGFQKTDTTRYVSQSIVSAVGKVLLKLAVVQLEQYELRRFYTQVATPILPVAMAST